MNPLKFKMAMDYLTRAKRVKPDLPDVFPASQAPIPPVKEEIQTRDAINAFIRRERQQKAGGGMLVQPGFGGVRQGYADDDVNLYEKYGKKKIDKATKEWIAKSNKEPNRVNKIEGSTFDSLNKTDRNNFKRKYLDDIEKYGEFNPNRKVDSRQKRVLKEQDIQIKLLEETNKKKFFDPKKFAKNNNISLPELKKQSALLQKNIYNKRMKIAGKEMRYQLNWIPDDPTFSDNALNKLWKSKLIKYERDKIDELFYDAFGREFKKGTRERNPSYNRRKFLAIKKNLNEYRQLRKAINFKYPNINFELDHPLSKSSLNKLFNATAEQLTRVNPLEADLNNGFKDALSLQYEKAVQNKNLNQKKAVEKIARDLKLNIGKISDDATNFKYGVKEFQKLNMRDEVRKALLNLDNLNKNFQDYANKNPELFKTAGVSTKQTFTQISPSEIKGIENIIASFGDGSCAVEFGPKKREGGRIGYQLGTTGFSKCFEQGARNFNDGKFKTAEQVQDAAKLLRGGRAVVSGLMKYGIIPELAYVGLEAAGRTLLGEKPTNSLLKSIDTLTFGATDFGSGITAEKFGKFSDQKLAVDKFKNSQALVNSLQSELKDLEATSDQGGEGYVGDLSSDIQVTKARLQKAQKSLQENTVSPDILQFIDKRGQEIADTELAKSLYSKAGLKDQLEGIPGISDYTDTQPARIFPKQREVDLNLDMFPQFSDATDIMQLKTDDAINLAQAYRAQGDNVSAKDILAYRDLLRNAPLSELAKTYGDEQIYGTQGADVLQPLAGGGIAKLAGVDSGPPPASGPNSQGLQGLMKRVKRI